MSKTLRRPMFRGGPVNSYNTGITSGLGEPGYADGGRVGAKVGGFFNFSKPGGLLPTPSYTGGIPQGGLTGLTQAYQALAPYISKAGNLIRGGTIPITSTLAVPAAAIGSLAYLNRPINEAELEFMRQNEEITSKETTDPNLYEGYFKGRAEAREKGEKMGQPKLGFFETFTKEPKEIESSFGPLRTSTEEDLAFATGTEVKKPSQPPSKTDDNEIDIEDVLNEKKIQREADLYARLLGGEEARSQALYDALLAASPAFFKGKNLREAAPEVLKAVSESKAFEKPQNIKQAAAQLAIQRRIAIETAKAKGEDQLTRLERSLAAKETIGSKLKAYGLDPKEDYYGSTTADVNLNTLTAKKVYSIGDKLYLAVPSQQMIKDPVTGQQKLGVAKLTPIS